MITTNVQERAGADHAQVEFHPPLLLLLCIGIGFAARWFAPAAFLPSKGAGIVGPNLVIAAFALFAWSAIVMRRGGASIPTGEPTDRLVFEGPYRFSRNPIYLSMVLLIVGVAVWANSLWFVALAVVMIVFLNWGVISREEQYLKRKFGDAYEAYRDSVRRWC